MSRAKPARSVSEQGDLSDLTSRLLTETGGRLASAPGAYLDNLMTGAPGHSTTPIASLARDGVLINPQHVADIGGGGNMQPRLSSTAADSQTRRDVLDLTHALSMAAAASQPFVQAAREARATNNAIHGPGGLLGQAARGVGAPSAVPNAVPNAPSTSTPIPVPGRSTRVGSGTATAIPSVPGGPHTHAHAHDAIPIPGDNPIEQSQEQRFEKPDWREYAGGSFYRGEDGNFHMRERLSFSEGREGSVGRLSRGLGTRLTHYTHGDIPNLVRNSETGQYHHANEDGSPGEAASQEEVERYERNSRITGRVRGIGQRIEAQGVLRSLPLGNIGIAYGVANEAIGQVQHQREINSQIRSITGDGSTSGVVGERVRSARFRLSTLGTFSGEQASELYRGTLESGFRGSSQQNALALATSQFRKNGVQVAEILQIMNTAAETGGKALNGVSEALDSVTKQAKATGVNAAELRKQFASTFQTLAENSGSGNPGTALLAAAQTTATAGLGSQFSNTNLRAQQSTVNLYRQAIASHESVGKFLVDQGRDPQFGAEASNKLIQQGVQTATSEDQRRFVAERLQELQRKHPDGKIPDNELSEVAEELQAEHGLNPIVAQTVLSGIGGVGGLTNDNTASYIVRYLAGQANPTNAAALAKSGSESISIKGQPTVTDNAGSRDKNRRKLPGGNLLGGTRYGAEWEYKLEHGGLVPGEENGTSSPGDSRAGGWTSGNETSPVYQYEKAAEKSGERNPVIEKLLTMNGGARGIRQLEKSKFRVATKDGEKDVSLNDAIKYYGDQLQAGGVEVIGGTQSGKTVSQLTGLGTGKKLEDTESGKAAAQGKTYDPDSDKEKKLAGGGGTVTITPSPLLQQYFNFSATGDAQINYGASTGTAPDVNTPTITKLGR